LWIVHTWAVQAVYVSPRLVLDSPEPGSGKTRVLEILALLCRSAKLTLSTTTAALYRRIAAAGEHPPTVLQDEADAVFTGKGTPQAEELRALFNAGYKRGATVDRCEGDAKNMVVREFPVFAPVALAGLAGKMPATITDRAITIHMRRRAPDETVADFRERDAAATAEPLRERIDQWVTALADKLTSARPTMPDGVRDRPAEVWEALIAIAELAEGEWPRKAREACRHFVLHSGADELSFGTRLLRDTRTVFNDRDRMFSADVVAALLALDESEWADLWGKPLDQLRLAKELRRYGVRSKDVRIGDAKAKGYHADGDDGLDQAWSRYLPTYQTRDKRDNRDSAGHGVSAPRHTRDTRDTPETTKTGVDMDTRENVSAVSHVSAANGNQNGRPKPALCPECSRAPARSDTGLCDLCSERARKTAIANKIAELGGDAA
jgi:hypothetical protein